MRLARSVSVRRSLGSMTPTTRDATSILQVEDVVEAAVEAVGPHMRAGRGVDQLAGDADPGAGLPDRAFEHVAHAQLARHLPHIDSLALVGEARIAGDHGQPGKAGDCGRDLLDDAVGEIFLLGVARHVLERQYRERRLVGQRQRRRLQSRRPAALFDGVERTR